MKHRPPVLLEKPIDFERLAVAYQKANWEWAYGFPNALNLAHEIACHKKDLKKRPGPNQVSSSGGLHVEWVDGKVVLKIDAKLFDHYGQKSVLPEAGLANAKELLKEKGATGRFSCDICNRFIPVLDFTEGRAIRQIVSVDSEHSTEDYETLCKLHIGLKK